MKKVLHLGICSVGSKEDWLSDDVGPPRHRDTPTRLHWRQLRLCGFLKVHKGLAVLPEHKSLFFSRDQRFTFEHIQLWLLPDLNSQVDWLSSRLISTMEEQLRKQVHGKERPCALFLEKA